MPDQYGNPTEAERRGQTAYAPPQGAISTPAPNLIFDGTIGSRRVQLYGEGPKLTQEQALARVAAGSTEESRNGAMPVSQWQALHPNATAAELKAYKALNKAYTAQTAGMSLGDKVGNAAAFEVDRFGNLIKGVANNPGQLLTGGIDPIGTKIGNTVTGSNNEALVGQFGGATESDFKRYEDKNGFGSLGAAREMSHAADNIAAIGGAAGAAHGIGQGLQSLTGAGDVATQTYRGGANLNYASNAAPAATEGVLPEIVVTGTRGAATAGGLSAGEIAGIGAGAIGAGAAIGGSGGSSGAISSSGNSGWGNTSDPVGSFSNAQPGAGNAGNLANSGGIEGGAGTGGVTNTAPAKWGTKVKSLIGSASSSGNGMSQPKNSTYTGKDAWFVNPARDALDRAGALADRPYTPYTGTRIASLSDNEQQAGRLAGSFSTAYQPYLDRLNGGYSAGALKQFENPYLDSVLNDRVKRIGEDYTTQASALDRNAAATDAFRTGRSDKARSRLASSRMRAVDEATNDAKSAAFTNAQNAYFQQGGQDLNTIGAIQSGQNSQIGALNSTGLADRSVRQAQADFDYGQHLEARDWDVNNLDSLLKAIGAVSGASGSLTKTKGEGTNWGAVGGALLTAPGNYYGSGS